MSESRMNPPTTRLRNSTLYLNPGGCALDRDQLMYAAGKAVADRRVERLRLWGAMSSAALLCVSTGFVTLVVLASNVPIIEPQPLTFHDKAEQNSPATQPALPHIAPDAQVSELSYLRLRRKILTHGIDSLPELPVNGEGRGEPQPTLKAGSRELPEELYGI